MMLMKIRKAIRGRGVRSPMARSRRSLRGKGKVWDWIKGAVNTVGNFVKKHQLLSKGGDWLAKSGLVNNPKMQMALGAATEVARKAGYGRRKARSGMGIRLAGGALRLAGARRY